MKAQVYEDIALRRSYCFNISTWWVWKTIDIYIHKEVGDDIFQIWSLWTLSNLRLYCSPCMSWHWRFHFCLIGFRITLTFSPLSNWLNSKFYEIQGKTKELVAVQIWTGLNAWSFNNFREFSQIKEFLMFTTWHISFFDKIQGKPSTLYVVGWVWTGFYFFSFNKLNKFRKLRHQI